MQRALRDYAAELGRRPEVLEVYLCGSWAKGTYTPYSDVDLLVMVRESALPPRERIPAYLPSRFPVGVDVFVYTPEEVKESGFVQSLLRQARRLWPKGSNPNRTSPKARPTRL